MKDCMKGYLVTSDLKRKVVNDVPIPSIEPWQVLVKTLSCGICNGTDLKIAHGQFKGFGPECYPVLLGHEAVGEVVEVGEDVISYKKGDWVMYPRITKTTENGYHTGHGAYCEYSICEDWRAMRLRGIGPGTPQFNEMAYIQTIVPKDIDPIDASMIITFREVYLGAKHFGFGDGKSVIIFGQGSVGLTFIRFAKLMGLHPIISVDIVDDKMDEAKKQGADYCINSTQEDIVSFVKELIPEGIDIMVDAVGINSLMMQGFEMIKMGGMIGIYGISPKLNMELDWTKAPYNWNIQFWQYPDFYEQMLANQPIINWIQSGALSCKDFISHYIPFDQINEAFDMVERKETTKKIVITY